MNNASFLAQPISKFALKKTRTKSSSRSAYAPITAKPMLLFAARFAGCFCLLIFSFMTVSNAQTDPCTSRIGGAVGGFWGTPQFRANEYCADTPGDVVSFLSGPTQVTCRNCMPGDSNHAPMFNKGGTTTCTSFEKQMVIEFSQPVAALHWGISGAKTVTDNHGHVLHSSIDSWVARFNHGDITSITITDPTIHDDWGVPGFWEIWSGNVSWTDNSTYQQCSCDRPPVSAPTLQMVTTDWGKASEDWSMIVEVTEDDGLEISDILLGSRYMAEKINVPYYLLETSAFAKRRGELKPASTDLEMQSHLVNFYKNDDGEKLVIEATYVVKEIPAGSDSCLEIIQRYEFYKARLGDHCEPTGTLPCSRFRPIVKYRFVGGGGETLTSVEIAQRQHRKVDGNIYNSIGLFRDVDSYPGLLLNLGGFVRKANPLYTEWIDPIIKDGQDTQRWDNIHQTYLGVIDEPGILGPGCPECLHSHWRWGTWLHGEGHGNPIQIAPGSTQGVDLAIVAEQFGQDDPTNFRDLVQRDQLIRTFNIAGRSPLQVYLYSAPEDVVYWQAGTGRADSETFFEWGTFFVGGLANQQVYDGGHHHRPSSKTGEAPLSPESEDSLTSIFAAQLHEEGEATVSPFDISTLPPLPAGFTQLGDLSFDITTTAKLSGAETINYSVPSVVDEGVFQNLRIFHLEKDPFAPTEMIWVDRTVFGARSAGAGLRQQDTERESQFAWNVCGGQSYNSSAAQHRDC